MHVEECSLALLHYYLPEIDKLRRGFGVDIGVGNFDFYCELFARIGFDTVAVEPLPTPELVRVCKILNINLIQSCVSDVDGTNTLFIGTFNGSENRNLSSLRPDWWGASSQVVQVRSITVDTLLKTIDAGSITCMKLDVEGVESIIIQQLQDIPDSLLPQVVVFEYGGGGTRENGEGSWSENGINNMIECFRILKKLHYRTSIRLDSASDSHAQIFDLNEVDLDPETLFSPQSIYGNVICFRNHIPETDWIEEISSRYKDNNVKPQRSLPKFGILERIKWRMGIRNMDP
ncbi:MAG: FkbM family methyltransferase [Methanoregula sp.]